MPRTNHAIRRLPHQPPTIVPATDLGGVTVLKRGRLFLLSDEAGDIVPDARGLGLYDGDTRVLSCLDLRVNGVRPGVLRPDPGGADRGSILLINPEVRRDPGDNASPELARERHSLGIRRVRRLADGFSEEVSVANYADHGERLTIELFLDADMADIFEVRGIVRPRRGVLGPIGVAGEEATFAYQGLDQRRRVTRIQAPGARIEPAPDWAGAALAVRWQLQLGPDEQCKVSWSARPEIGEPAGPARKPRLPVADSSAAAGPGGPPPRSQPAIAASDSPALDRVISRGLADLELLVTPGPGPGQRYPSAGIPWFSALFGRDAILASYGAVWLDPTLAIDTLRALAGLQAGRDDPMRDAEPGKFPHEVRDGEMARAEEVPFGRYYGSADVTPLWLVLLGEVYDWTGDLDLVRELWPNARAALAWMERHGDRDGDGFIEYERRAPGGLIHHGWKDAPDAIRDRDGHVAESPIALAEVQGYAYDARLRMAGLARAIGDVQLAARLEADARALRSRFDPAFWVADRATYALALDGRKRQMDAIGSNQGHALWSGIVADVHAHDVANRLTGTGMDSGWGIRTFAAGQPGYNPMGYHTGTVWPHDTAIAVAGLRRAGFDAVAGRIAEELLAAAREFPDDRLPELFCGFARDEVGPPVPYPVACSPQAWSAAAPLLVLRAMLGLRPRAAEGVLELQRPELPAGVANLTISGLAVGSARVDLHVRRHGGSIEVALEPLAGALALTVVD